MAGTPRVTVVEIDDLHFRIHKLRGRRSLRAAVTIQQLIGPTGFNMLHTPEFWGSGATAETLAKLGPDKFEQGQLAALGKNVERSGATPDQWENAIAEVLGHRGGQGVCYSDSPLEQDAAGWVPIKDAGSLDPFGQVDHKTWLALAWEMVKLSYRPTGAADGTPAGTGSAASTSTQASAPSGAAKPRPGGSQAKMTGSGCTGG